MAPTRDYKATQYTSTMSPHRHPKTAFTSTSASSSSTSPQPASGSSSMRHPSSSSHRPPTNASQADGRRRRGRQARPSQLSTKMGYACKKFAHKVGAPNVVEPAGFRDFRGWLADLGTRECRQHWEELLAAIAKEVGCDPHAVHALKEDIVREIIKNVVVPRPEESAKLVSTNAGRQASRPKSGTTLMVVLEQQLDRVDKRLPQLVAQVATPSSSSDGRSDHVMGGTSEGIRRNDRHHRSSPSGSHRSRSTSGTPLDDERLPSVSDILGHRKPALPSFQELDASLKRSSGGSSSRR